MSRVSVQAFLVDVINEPGLTTSRVGFSYSAFTRLKATATNAVPWDVITPTMPLVTGARLGPYEIVSPLGAHGMGEVYKHQAALNRFDSKSCDVRQPEDQQQ